MRKFLYLIILLSVIITTACKKTSPTKTEDENTPPPSTSAFDLTRDSVFLYAKEAYYWNDGLPTYAAFKPRSFSGTDELSGLSKEVDAISQYKTNPATGLPYEYYSPSPGEAKYSFIDDGTVSSELNGVKGDFGFAPLYNDVNDLRIRYVYPGSPADLAGVRRGYQITSINGRTNLSYDGNSSSTNVNFVVNAYANSTTITMVLKKFDGSNLNVTLNAATYTLNPVLVHKVFDQGNGHKVGYIVFNSFTSDANARPKLNEAFTDFQSQGVTDLVVDLRYNGGGYVSTAEYLSNLIAPASKSGSLMYNTYFNSTLTGGKASILKNQVRKDETTGQLYNYGQFDYTVTGNAVNFSKSGVPITLASLNRVFFIVTGSTASASELTINNIRPVLDVKLIGTQSYGKPVGFFDIDISKYQMYIPEFETKNSAGQGGYYSGMLPGSTDYPGLKDFDDVTKDFGDATEGLLAHALNYVKNGTFTVAGQQIQSTSRAKTLSVDESNKAGIQLDGAKFTGMIFNKPLKLKK